MRGRVADKRAVVVGAGQTAGQTIGNGRAIALRLAQEGAEVLCVDRDLARAEETAAVIASEGGSATPFEADITRPGEARALVDAALARFGRIDILVNNVGVGGAGGEGPPHIADEVVFDGVFDVNFKGMWRTIKAVLPHMRAARGGAIVNISSLASLVGYNTFAYGVSKAAVNRMTLAVALSNAEYGVRCNAVLPGMLDTPMAIEDVARASGRDIAELRATRNARVPLNAAMGTGWDTANAALFLASDEASFITGVLLPVDGGMSINVG